MHQTPHHLHAVSVLQEHFLPILEQPAAVLVTQGTLLILVGMIAHLVNKVITLQVQDLLLVLHVLQAITPLLLNPQCVKSVLKVLLLQLDQVAALNAHLEPTERKREVLNVLIVQLGDIHQEMDQQAVNRVLQGHMLLQDQLYVAHVKEEVLPARKVVVSVPHVLLAHFLSTLQSVNPAVREAILLHLDLLVASLVPQEVTTSTVQQPAAHVQQESINRILDRRRVCHARILPIEHPLGMQQYAMYLVLVCSDADYICL